MRENIITIINQVLSNLWIFVLIGITYGAVLEYKLLLEFYQKRKAKILKPLLHRLSYLALGIILVLLAFAIVNSILSIIVPSVMPMVKVSNIPPNSFLGSIKSQKEYIGLFSVIGLIMAGISLIISAGGKWMVTLAKLLATLSIIYLFFATIISYA